VFVSYWNHFESVWKQLWNRLEPFLNQFPNGLGSRWNHVVIDLGLLVSCWNQCVGIVMEPFWNRGETVVELFGNNFGISLATVWDRVGTILESLWDRVGTSVGTVLGSLCNWNRFGIILDPL